MQPVAAAGIDYSRLHRQRYERLQEQMAAQGVDALVLLHRPHVAYATGAPVTGDDVTHAVHRRPVAVVVAGQPRAHLLTDHRSGGLDVEAHAAVWPELDEGAVNLSGVLREVLGDVAGRRIGVDELTGAMLRSDVLAEAEQVDAARVVGAAKLVKTEEELACIGEAQRLTQAAMVDTQAALAPGRRRSEVSGVFLRRLHELGAGPNLIDPIFQPMPRRIADGPRTTTGHVAFPTGVGDRPLAWGALVWVDAGVDFGGYASDFGRTWVVGRDPTAAEHGLFDRWQAVMDAVLDRLVPGCTSGDLARAAAAAADGKNPWLPHFYLAHGVGIESAEMPLIGTDLGPAFDDAFVLAPGMVLVLEPVIWEDGVGGYRAEEIVAVTEDGWRLLGGGHPYAPFGP
ncbi:MAG: Xaa-Pro peptidase family protein [Acidimicrobiales bacterium]